MRITVWLGTSCLGLLLTDYLVRKSLEKINTNATDSTSKSDLIIRLMAVIWFWALLGLITSIASPGISFLFILPGLAGALVAIYVYFRIKTHKKLYSTSTTVSLITMVAVSTAVFLLIAYVFEILVGYNIALAIGIILGFSMTALLPMLSLKTTAIRPYRRISSCTLLIAALAFGWTTRYPAYSVAMPQALNIFYVQNNTSSARVLAGFQQNRLPHSLSSELEKFSSALRHTGELFWETQKYHQVTVPSAGLEPSLLAIVDIQHSEPKRSVKVQLTTDPKDLSDLRIFIKYNAGLESIAYLNQTFHYTDDESRRNGYYEYHCRGTSCADLRLTFNFSHREKVHLRVVKAIQGLPTELKHLASARGADATQRQQGDQTYIYADYDI